MNRRIRKLKRAVSPVIATVLLISLVVAASAMVYFIVVPLLRGSASVNIVTTQWFDSDGDDVTDLVYITLQNSGSASTIISNITITVNNDALAENIAIDNAELVVEELPLTLDVTARMDIAISFDPSAYISVGTNNFQIILTYSDGLSTVAPENLNHASVIYPLELTVLNPINGSWVKGIIDPQVLVSGGYLPTGVTYDFLLPDQTVVFDDENLATDIDSTDYDDDLGYKMTFAVNDALNQSDIITNTFNIDNKAIGVTLSLSNSSINQGDYLNATWVWDELGGAPVINQTLVLSGDVHNSESVFTATDDTITSYDLLGFKTAIMAEDDFTLTLYVKDAVGNLNSSGKAFSLVDILAPTSYVLTPENNSVGIEGVLTIEVYADDPSGIDTTNFDIYFFSQTTDFYYLYQNVIDDQATYNVIDKTWELDFNSYLLPDDDYAMVTFVYDSSDAMNAKTTIILMSVANPKMTLSGAVGVRGFFSRSTFSFFLTNNLPNEITITQIYIDWEPDNRADYIFEMRDNTDGTIWLDPTGQPYAQESVLPVNGGTGAVLDGGSIHKLTILFDYFDRTDKADFEIRFYIQELGVWQIFFVDQ
ncbi:MAG: hypothetical protein GOP50_12820 [Candidatus Heimdallarchaeota archaeon]|nr:hypothetical protein [Candidatus Heimdallarchaeota archaeon]